MASVQLSQKSVGDTVKLNVSGALTEFLIIHQGKPSDVYDASCDGSWLLLKTITVDKSWGSGWNNYKKSTIHAWLNGDFLSSLDSVIQANVKQVKIPYIDGNGDTGKLATGASGLSCKVFLLSGLEVGFSGYDFKGEGSVLSYFEDHSAQANRDWWTRTPYRDDSSDVYLVTTSGTTSDYFASSTSGIRPALILSESLWVSDDGQIFENNAPKIISPQGESGVNLGTKSEPFQLQYIPIDADGDTLTVTEKLDGTATKTRSGIASGTQLTFECASTATEFQKILNGSHAITIEANDGKETAAYTATFEKAVHRAAVTLAEPLAAESNISMAALTVKGQIPEDAGYKVEVTNNAKDSEPVWQNVTGEVKQGINILFENQTCINGAAFNFRIAVERGPSSEEGYIAEVSGSFR